MDNSIIENLKNTENNILELLTKNWNIYEIALNILFVSLLFVIGNLIYWDSINKKIKETSRCRRQKELYNKTAGIFSVNIKNKNNENMFKVEYDFNNKKQKIDCNCSEGKVGNTFDKIPIRNIQNNKNEYSKPVNCMCDKEYKYDNSNKDLILEGEPELIRYMNDQEKTDFFDNVNNYLL